MSAIVSKNVWSTNPENTFPKVILLMIYPKRSGILNLRASKPPQIAEINNTARVVVMCILATVNGPVYRDALRQS